VLLDKLLLRHGEPVAQEEVLERILVEDVVHVEGVAGDVEIEPVIAGPEAVEGLPLPVEAPERLARVLQVRLDFTLLMGSTTSSCASVSSLFSSRMACSEKVT
jgi:hypothetical protein